MTLEVSNVGVSQTEPAPSITATTSTTSNIVTSITARAQNSTLNPTSNITVAIATNLAPSLVSSVTWTRVNVTQGWYILLASIPAQNISRFTSPFYVRTGTNTSCLVTNATSSTVAPSSSINTATSITSQSTSPTPVSEISSSSSLSRRKIGIIVGVIVGITALVIAAIATWLCAFRGARSRRSGGSPSRSRRWNGLSSFDSRGLATKVTNRSSGSHLHSAPGSAENAVGTGFEDIGAEKLNFNGKASYVTEERGVALSTLPVLHSQSERPTLNRTNSASSSTSNVINVDEALPVGSTDTSSCPIAAANMFRTHSQSTTGAHSSSHSQQTSLQSLSSPLVSNFCSATASQETKLTNRHSQSLGKRKPVPVYDPNLETISSTFAPQSSSFSTTEDSIARDLVEIPELSHKRSFGPGGIEGVPLHYLIPDMPTPLNR